MKHVTIFADGAYKKSTKTGGYAAAMVDDANNKLIVYDGTSEETTNNRMELQAAVRGMQNLNQPCQVHLVCDSRYVLNGVKDWVEGWEENDWKTSKGKDVANKDLWKQLSEEKKKHKVTTQWVKGHQEKKSFETNGNNLADYFASTAAIEEAEEQKILKTQENFQSDIQMDSPGVAVKTKTTHKSKKRK